MIPCECRSCDSLRRMISNEELTKIRPDEFRSENVIDKRPIHASARSRTGDSMKTFSFAKASCLLFGICLALAIHAPAQTFTVLQNFDQSDPTSALVQGLDGNFYGTMEGGNIGFEGNVYKLTPGGSYTTIASPCCYSYSSMVLASNSYFYGSTAAGGTALEGNIYKMTASGATRYPIQLLYDHLRRRRLPERPAGATRQRRPLRNHPHHYLQNHLGRRSDHALQFLPRHNL